MTATNFNTKNDTYRKLMGNGLTYRIPMFQRDYSWSEEEWDDLWQDILGTLSVGGETAHYMGYLVLQSSDDKMYDVIDGQQRLTTLSILILAALRNLKRLQTEGKDDGRISQRLEGLRQTYVGYLDPVTLVPKSKLTLNRNNDSYYQTYLVPLNDNLPQRGFKSSEHSLRKAFEWFDRRIREYVKNEIDQGLAIAQLVDSMSDKLFFTVITVTDELNAYKVFETLNARGVRLSATDLLKNYLFSVIHKDGQHEHELKALDDRWELIVGRLGPESFPDFLRAHWISSRSFVRQADLFKTIRGKLHNRQQVFSLLKGMDEDIDTYRALTSPKDSAWPQQSRNYAIKLRMFSVKQPIPLLISAKRILNDFEFEALLRVIVVISFRYNVIGNLQTGEQERTYHACAERISRREYTKLPEIIEGLRSIYPSDEVFKAAFAEKTIVASSSRNRSVLKYIFSEFEAKSSPGLNLDVDNDSITIEHICPRNPDGGWDDFTDEELEIFPHRIGNMTLLTFTENKDAANKEYDQKKYIYEKSNYQITREIFLKNEVWTPEKIIQRQKSLAKMACGIWNVPQLS